MKKLLLITVCSLLFAALAGCARKQPAITNEAAQTSQTTLTPEAASEKTFTLEELTKCDGKNGQPAYLAIDGLVYDLSSVFFKGEHYDHMAGKSLTKEFYSKHSKKSLEGYKIVGKLVE